MVAFQALKEDFVESLLAWVDSSEFGAVVMMTGVSPSDRKDSQMRSVYCTTSHSRDVTEL